jgi:hypothetical protein
VDASDDDHDEQPAACSFCDKTEADVRRLISGHSAFICDECVRLCLEVVGAPAEAEPSPSQHVRQAWADFFVQDQWALASMAGLLSHFAEQEKPASGAVTDGLRMMEVAMNQARRRLMPPKPRDLAAIDRCGFCSKSGDEIRQLNVGYGGQICGDCLDDLVKVRAAADGGYRAQLVEDLIGLTDLPAPPTFPS